MVALHHTLETLLKARGALSVVQVSGQKSLSGYRLIVYLETWWPLLYFLTIELPLGVNIINQSGVSQTSQRWAEGAIVGKSELEDILGIGREEIEATSCDFTRMSQSQAWETEVRTRNQYCEGNQEKGRCHSQEGPKDKEILLLNIDLVQIGHLCTCSEEFSCQPGARQHVTI